MTSSISRPVAKVSPVSQTGPTTLTVRFGPEGLQFAAGQHATLTLSYANCPLLGSLLPKRIAYTTDLLSILSYVISVDDLVHRRVSGSLEHFSRYAVAW